MSIFKQMCYTARHDYPGDGEKEIAKIKTWIRQRQHLQQPEDLKRSLAWLRFYRGELEATISLAKYRAMKRRYDRTDK
ncbi:unnamed protein product [Vitrella brassicaformis CCMP3155]|uniref:Uncharacterized protein n=1 Tax=Vitrella brassicaformis (strain CCMP3155) TaxID=1169540 RepID=A0A0G4H8L4_VITBC|nr:unnamed protein product [Vitrella brassicaformis CCMP3155]|eukprot:CEM40121.1 unnamed protein product [Vitrella brassicaformis CCMP3155]